MKKLQLRDLSYFLLIPLFLVSGKQAHSQAGEKGLLWEISGKGIKKSYLYGTIHIQDKKVFAYDPVVETKLEETKAFAMELVLDEINQMELAQSMMMLDHSLTELLTPEEYQQVSAVFKEKSGLDLKLMDHVKPFMVYTQLMQGEVSNGMPDPLDMYFLKKARANKQKVLAVEKLSEQLGAINSISVQDQAKMLVQMVKDTAGGTEEFNKLIDIYLSQDLSQMLTMAEDPAMPKEISEQFLIARNKVMAERIEGFIKEQSTFTAIGAAHLGGKTGVINLLRKAGYKLTAVPFTFKN